MLAPVDAAARVWPLGSRSERTCAGQSRTEEMEGEALFRGRERCAASYTLGGESGEVKALRDGEDREDHE